jgi:serine beta-lactamase-like protein LACTB
MSKNRMQTWLALAVVGVGLLISAIVGLWAYLSISATPLHSNAQGLPSVTQSAPSPRWAGAVEQGRQIVRAHVLEKNVPGVSVAVGISDTVVWAEGFGWADLENRVKVAPDMRFRIGTASTALTSAAVGVLLERGRLQPDAAIQTYVPGFPEKQWPITLRQLMAHVAGLKNDGGDEGPLFGVHCERPSEALSHFAAAPLLFEPGTRFHYSSYGWIVVSAAVEAAASEPFFTFMRKAIFEPLHMENTRIDSPNRVTSYFPRFAADPRYGPDVNREIDLSCYAGSSALLSTPSDLVRFAMTMNHGTLLQPATVQLLQTSQRLTSGQETGYGLGWRLETVTVADKTTRAVGHDGNILGGMVASFMTLPEFGMVVAVTANISYADTHALATKIAQAFAARGTS